MNPVTISLELQQVFILLYGALIFWSLVFVVVGTIGLAVVSTAQEFVRLRKS